ncbi:MAG: response regulator transcription factor [Flavobacteriales bacterium]
MELIDILLVDDHHLVLDGMRALLALEPEFNVVGEARNGREAVEKATALRPRIVIMDISMPEMDGIEATKLIRKNKDLKETFVMVLSMYGNREFIDDLLDAGASGYLLKNTGRAELREAIHTVSAGQRYLCKPVQDTMDAPYRAHPRAEGKAYVTLTKREKEIIRFIASGKCTSEIAGSLNLSPATVETHRKNILHKLDMHSTAGLVRYAVERGWNLEN